MIIMVVIIMLGIIRIVVIIIIGKKGGSGGRGLAIFCRPALEFTNLIKWLSSVTILLTLCQLTRN